MFDEMRYRWRVRRTRREMAKTTAADHTKIIEGAKAGKSAADLQGLLQDEEQHVREYRDWIAVLQSRHLMNQADRLQIPAPNRLTAPDKWMQTWDYDHCLTLSAAAQLRTEIRNERKARQEIWHSRVTLVVSLITTATGLVGVVIGLLAYWATHSAK